MTDIDFHAIEIEAPTYAEISTAYREIQNQLESATHSEQRYEAIQSWDQLRRNIETWECLTELRFHQDTRNDAYKKAREYCDALRPKLMELAVNMKRALIESPFRDDFERHYGLQAFAIWQSEIMTYDPVIELEMIQEATLCAEYTELLAGAEIEFRGECFNLPEIVKFREDPNRTTRLGAEQSRWSWYEQNRERLDLIFDELVKLRTIMARKLGFHNFVELGYRRMMRIDYHEGDVSEFRDAVRETVVPLCEKICQQQAEDLTLDRVAYWDESIFDLGGNPKPLGDHGWLLKQAQEMFEQMGGGLDSFFRKMVSSDLMDLKGRDGKAGGGFCTAFPSYGVPFIFANFNGTKGDVEVFTHEMGHAFQSYESRDKPLLDYLWPTYESCEIHSMSLEFLTWPYMEKFFGDDATRFRRIHLIQSLLFLPYGVAIDHFQHLIYSEPSAKPAERNAMWQEMERMYLPWREYDNLPHVADGGLWQSQRHLYLSPFYYVDYTLALTCALQFWLRSDEDRAGAIRNYVALCQRGGEAPFQELVKSAGLKSPFEKNCLVDVVRCAERFLDQA